MDVLSDLLHRSRARNAQIRQLIQQPPWSMTFADAPSLTVVATLGGQASVRLDDGPQAAPGRLAAGDIARISGTNRYTIADAPDTPPQVVIRGGRKHVIDSGTAAQQNLAPRTYGDGLPGATTLLRGPRARPPPPAPGLLRPPLGRGGAPAGHAPAAGRRSRRATHPGGTGPA